MINVVKGDLSDTQVSTDLISATYPGTVVGLRWQGLIAASSSSTAAQFVYWAIVLVKDGGSAGTMAYSDAGAFYQPEQDCIAYGQVYVPAPSSSDQQVVPIEGHTKSMRKLQAGDKLQFILLATAKGTLGAHCGAVVQFFYKS